MSYGHLAAIIISPQGKLVGSKKEAKKLILEYKPDIKRNFKLLFEPRSIAFLGASRDPQKWGFRILGNLMMGGFQGRVYPVNPKKGEVLGLKVYGSVGDIPETPDLAVIVVPPTSVVDAVKECINKGIKAGVVITAGFAEIGKEGEKVQQEIVETAHGGGMILVGPNSFGIINPLSKLHSQMPPIFPPPGPIAVVSQSGNLVATIARMVIARGFGYSKGISSGNEAALHSEDYLEYLADDPQTKVILSYIEGLKDGHRFFETAKKVTKKKPVIMLKAGETPAGARAAKSHTASLAGSDTVFDAMCKQAGVIRVRNLDELVNAGFAFLCHPLPQGRRVGIVTAGGGWGVLAADACAKLGLDVVPLPDNTLRELDSFLPAWWNRGNPIDLVAGAFGNAMMKSVEVIMRCPVVDGVIMMGLMPSVPEEFFHPPTGEEAIEKRRKDMIAAITHIFEEVNGLVNTYQKPVVIASDPLFNSARTKARLTYALGGMNAVCYDMPHEAAAALASLAKYSEYLKQDNA